MNCWNTIATLRFCTGTPVTLRPSNQISPELGGTSPAISCIRVVLPASVVPSRMLNPPDRSSMLVSWMCVWPPTRRTTCLSASVTVRVPLGRGRDGAKISTDGEPAGSPSTMLQPRSARSALGPALDELVVVDRDPLRLLVGELRLRAVRPAEPLLRILLRIEARAAAAVDLVLLVGLLHPRHHLVHLLRQPVHRLLRRERARVDVADVLPPELGELRIVRHVDA